jgi:hypothetical protein
VNLRPRPTASGNRRDITFGCVPPIVKSVGKVTGKKWADQGKTLAGVAQLDFPDLILTVEYMNRRKTVAIPLCANHLAPFKARDAGRMVGLGATRCGDSIERLSAAGTLCAIEHFT